MRVAQLFSRPARVAAADFLLREVAQRMHERLDLLRVTPQCLLDAGAGASQDALLLQARYPQAQVLACDLSPQQLVAGRDTAAQGRQAAQSVLGRVFGRWLGAREQDSVLRLAADYASLPLPAQQLDMLWSNLALHWHPRPPQVFAEWRRVLRTDGVLMFSSFGPDTLRQLRDAFAAAGRGSSRVLPFVDMHDLGDMLLEAGFANPVIDMEVLTLTWQDSARLLADVRALGGNPRADRARGLTGRRAWHAMLEALPKNADGHYQMNIEVVYGHAFCPPPRTTREGESVVRFMPRPAR